VLELQQRHVPAFLGDGSSNKHVDVRPGASAGARSVEDQAVAAGVSVKAHAQPPAEAMGKKVELVDLAIGRGDFRVGEHVVGVEPRYAGFGDRA
jgi:hypothetical protein